MGIIIINVSAQGMNCKIVYLKRKRNSVLCKKIKNCIVIYICTIFFQENVYMNIDTQLRCGKLSCLGIYFIMNCD